MAIQQQVPLIFWGEPSAEYTAYYDYRDNEIEEVDEKKFNRSTNLGITAEDMAGMISDDFEFDPPTSSPSHIRRSATSRSSATARSAWVRSCRGMSSATSR